MRFAEVVKLLAAPFPAQESFLGDLPENCSVVDYDVCNDIYRMTILFLDSLAVYEGDGGSEGLDHWRSRTQIRPEDQLETQWLATAMQMLFDLSRPFYYTRHGLRSSHEWRLIRRLAGEVCDEMGWSYELSYPDFETLWNDLSAGLFDNRIEQVRWRFKNEGLIT